MAVMRKEQKDIDELGPIGIVGEALKVFWAHAKVFTLIQLALMLDLAILMLVVQYYLYKSLPYPDPGPDHNRLLAGTLHVRRLAGYFKVPSHGGSAGLVGNYVLMLLAVGAGTVAFRVALSLSCAANLYAVGCHYAGQAVSFVDVIRASTPRLWMRLSLTNTYATLLSWSFALVQTVCILLLIQYDAPQLWLLVGTAGLVVPTLIVSVWLSIIFTVAAGVSVLEEDYGWAAVNKSLKLLKGKKTVAILFQLVVLVPFSVQFGFQSVFRSLINKSDYSPLTLTLLVFGIVVYLGWTTFIWQLHALCSGVQYASFKAYHDESLADSLYEKGTTEGGYEHIGDGRNESLLGGQQADSTV